MKKFDFAILSKTTKDVVGIFTTFADSLDEAMKRARRDPDMEDVSFYPIKG